MSDFAHFRCQKNTRKQGISGLFWIFGRSYLTKIVFDCLYSYNQVKFYWRKVGFSFEQIERPKQCNMATITAKALEQMMQAHVKAETGLSLEQANPRDYWTALSKSIVEIISENWMASRHKYNQGRQAHYFSAEFLEGRSMLNNLVNLGIYDQAKEALASFGLDITDILEEETDPALGNGGL